MLKLSVCCIVKDDTFYLEMMLNSASEFADEIIVVEDTDTEDTDNFKLCSRYKNVKYFKYSYGNHNGKGRQFAHNLATGNWILWLDADECIHEFDYPKIKVLIKEMEKNSIECADIPYIHFIENFSKIDNSEPLHIGINRLYKNFGDKVVLDALPHHSLPTYQWKKKTLLKDIKIWHLGYLRGMEKIRERFFRNFYQPIMHLPYQQCRWRDWHYFGLYPTLNIEPNVIPKVIKDKFGMNLGRE